MQFRDIIGQEELKRRLVASVAAGRVSHAQLFTGAAGAGTLPLAVAYAQYLNCRHRADGDSCGVCPDCRQIAALAHPDLHLVFPVNKQGKKSGEVITSDAFLPLFRTVFARSNGYFSPQEWYDALDLGKTLRGAISAREAAEIAEGAAEEAAESDAVAPTVTETTVKVVTSFAPEALYRDATGKTMIVDPGAFTRPGGAYEDGAFGPEQILCSESNLYPILVAHKRDFYDKNRDYRRGSLFTDRALYVPEVLFSRGGDVRRADVLVIAEPIRAYALENHRSERECDKALADRIETIFRVAAANGAETLIMGAFGCGRNGYPVEQVIELIQNWIAEHPGAVPNVVFAVPRMHADAFREAFGAPEPERPAPVVVAEGENDREGDDEDWRNVELPEGVTLR